jgi:hypothetical protein
MQALWDLYRLEDRQSRQEPSDHCSVASSHINGYRILFRVLARVGEDRGVKSITSLASGRAKV